MKQICFEHSKLQTRASGGASVDLSGKFDKEITYLTPSGSLITLPNTVQPSFTGRTFVDGIDVTISKGPLLGFYNGEYYVAEFINENNALRFIGYVKPGTKIYYPGISGLKTSKDVLIGREGENCSLTLAVGNYTSEPLIKKN